MLSMNAITILILLLAIACVIQCAAIVHITIKSDQRFKELERRMALQGTEGRSDAPIWKGADREAC